MKKHTMVVLVVLLSLLAGATSVSAKVDRDEFEFTETMLAPPLGGDYWYPSGDREHVRGMELLYIITADDQRFSGTNTVVVNANLDGSSFFCCGPMWGTFRNVASESGYWEGTWTGKAADGEMRIKARGRGYGDLAGLQIRTVEESVIGSGVITGTAVIRELPSK
jgi:hypothetical protein